MTLEGLLFAAVGFAWGKEPRYLVALLALAGACVALSAHYSVRLSEQAFAKLKRDWKELLPGYGGPLQCGFDLATSGCWWGVLLPHHFMPVVLSYTWLMVTVIGTWLVQAGP